MDSLPPTEGGIALVTDAAPGYFETVGTSIRRGRAFTTNEGFGTEPVVIVNEELAETIWPGVDAVGRCLVVAGVNEDACAQVVGIAQNVHQMRLKEDAISQVYVPWGQNRPGIEGSVLLVRATDDDDPRSVVPALIHVLRRAAPELQSVEIETFEELLDPQVRPWRVGATLFGLFGMTVVAVGAIGLFSIVSYLATQRTHELGVRIALGARRGHVLSLVMGSGLRIAIAGTVVGSAVSIAIGPFLQPLLFDNRARDPWNLITVAAGLLVVAAVASLWPSWRASRVDPLQALRHD